MVVLLTGLCGVGKTTIAEEIKRRFSLVFAPIDTVDSDVYRPLICSDLGFSEKDRNENVRRLSVIAKALDDNGINVLISAIAPYHKGRDAMRHVIPNMQVVYLHGEFPVLHSRRQLLNKVAPDAVGRNTVDKLYEIPQDAVLELDTTKQSVDECVRAVASLFLCMRYRLPVGDTREEEV